MTCSPVIASRPTTRLLCPFVLVHTTRSTPSGYVSGICYKSPYSSWLSRYYTGILRPVRPNLLSFSFALSTTLPPTLVIASSLSLAELLTLVNYSTVSRHYCHTSYTYLEASITYLLTDDNVTVQRCKDRPSSRRIQAIQAIHGWNHCHLPLPPDR